MVACTRRLERLKGAKVRSKVVIYQMMFVCTTPIFGFFGLRSSFFRLRKKDEYWLATEYTLETQSGLDSRLIRHKSGKPTQLQSKNLMDRIILIGAPI